MESSQTTPADKVTWNVFQREQIDPSRIIVSSSIPTLLHPKGSGLLKRFSTPFILLGTEHLKIS